MIDTKEYNLLYYRKSDRLKFHGKRIMTGHYSLVNSRTGEKLTATHRLLSKEYDFDEQNKTFRLPTYTMAKKRKVKFHSRAFQEYLNG